MLLGLHAGLVEQTEHNCLLSKPSVSCSFHCQMQVAWVSTGRSGLCLLDQSLEIFPIPLDSALSFVSIVNCLSCCHATRCHPVSRTALWCCSSLYHPSGQVYYGHTGKMNTILTKPLACTSSFPSYWLT